MKYTRKNAKLEDYFDGEELKRIKMKLEEADREIENGAKTYTLEEVIENLEMNKEEKERMIKQMNEYAENMKKIYFEKCKMVIKKCHIRKYNEELKQYIS